MKNNKYFFLIIIVLMIMISSFAVIFYQNYISKNVSNPNAKIITDYWNRSVEINKIPEKVISFSPSITEFLYEIGAFDRIVGVSSETTYPNGVKDLSKLAYYDEIEFDKILELQPQIIFASKYTYKEICDVFAKKNIPVVYIEPSNYSQIFTTLDILGNIFDINAKTDKLKDKIKSEINTFISNNKVEHNPDILFVEEINPLYIAGYDTLINDIIDLSGGKNAANKILGYSNIDNNQIKNMNIDIIIFSNKLKGKVSIKDLKENDTFMDTNAVKNESIFFALDDELYINPSARILKPIREMNSQIKIYSKKINLENKNE